jgi:hypothetical protein
MKYMLLLYQEPEFETEWEQADEQARARVMEQFEAFSRLAGERILSGEELGLSNTATTVRKASDTATEAVVTDGPFAELAEQIGGYFVIEVADLDEALELAKAVPVRTIELRPVVEYDGEGG